MADEMSKVRVGSSESEYSASERLRAMLDERGIEYTTNDFGYCRDTIWDGGAAVQLTRHAGLMMGVTPEQAIAATVGGSDVSALRAKVNAQSDYIGKLRGEYKALDEQMECRCAVYRATICKLKAELDAATVGAGTCEWCKDGKTFDRQTVMMTNHGWQKIRHCPNCGRRIEVGE